MKSSKERLDNVKSFFLQQLESEDKQARHDMRRLRKILSQLQAMKKDVKRKKPEELLAVIDTDGDVSAEYDLFVKYSNMSFDEYNAMMDAREGRNEQIESEEVGSTGAQDGFGPIEQDNLDSGNGE